MSSLNLLNYNLSLLLLSYPPSELFSFFCSKLLNIWRMSVNLHSSPFKSKQYVNSLGVQNHASEIT